VNRRSATPHASPATIDGAPRKGARSPGSRRTPRSDSQGAATTTVAPPVARSSATPRPEIAAGREPDAGRAVKHFVLDTNVLLHDADAIFAFEENQVVIPFTVLEELDNFKKGNDDIARSARAVIRHLDRLRERGSLVQGVHWSEEDAPPGAGRKGFGAIRIDLAEEDRPAAIRSDTADHRIIAVAYALQKQGVHTVFVSKDINARLKADALGIQAEDYENKKIDAERLYRGYVAIDVPSDVIDELYQQRMLPLEKLEPYLVYQTDDGQTHSHRVDSNQFVLLRDIGDPSHSGLARRLADTEHLIAVSGPRKPVYGVLARNIQQTMALDLLLDDELRLVTLTGGAGTGKTLLALAAGLAKVQQEEIYNRLLVARPIMPLGRDIGYLPGDKEEKLAAWMQPIFDNLEYLLSARGSHAQHAESRSTEQRVEKLMADGRLILEPLTYIRGRSIPHQFMIVDEAQNLTPHEIKTIVSRVGEGAKLVLTGDVEQIDNPYLDASSNGLSTVIERMRGEGLVGHVTLEKSERSELASLASARL